MQKVVLSIFLILVASVSPSVFAQGAPGGVGTPAGAGDKSLVDDSIKMRSVEMERMKQESKTAEAALFAPINKQISAKFPQIKEDYEGIQISEAAIIAAYTTGKVIDYGLIETSADAINKKAKRLDSNLFAVPEVKKTESALDDKSKQPVEKTKSIRDLIVDLDNAIGRFVSSKIFLNIKVIEPDLAISTRTDLLSVMQLSEKLSIEAKKLK